MDSLSQAILRTYNHFRAENESMATSIVISNALDNEYRVQVQEALQIIPAPRPPIDHLLSHQTIHRTEDRVGSRDFRSSHYHYWFRCRMDRGGMIDGEVWWFDPKDYHFGESHYPTLSQEIAELIK